MKHLFPSLLILLTFWGCTLSPLAFNNDARSQQVNKTLICAKQIDLYPLSINGVKPPKDAFDYYVKKLKKYTTDNIVIHETINFNIEEKDVDSFIHSYGNGYRNVYGLPYDDVEKFLAFRKETESKDSSIVMIYTPILHFGASKESELRGRAFTHSDKTNIVAYNTTTINDAPVISDTQAWKIVLTHEVGHRFHVPAKSDHNKMGHCTSRECVMYARPDWQAVVSVIFNGMPYDFCDKCKAELIEAKKSCNYIPPLPISF